MPRPKDIAAIDLMLGIPMSSSNHEMYEYLKPLMMDEESRQQFKMPAQYMFKDIPSVGDTDDKVGWVLQQMDKHNIERAMVGAYTGRPEISEAISKNRHRFLQCLDVNPNRGMEEVRRIKQAKRDQGINAVSIFPSGLVPQVAIDDKKMFPIYAACVEEGLPVFVNTGICGPRFPSMVQKTELIEEVVWFFPELKFVMRHGAEPWDDLAVKLMIKFPNLYYSPSAFRPKHYPKSIINYMNSRGADKVLYAGYFPMGISLDTIFSDLDNLPLKDEVWPKFLRENALKLFGIS
ncbi:amidohydrolase family protein [Sphingomonas crocodyli]|uniref:Amidohydrolase n=1 Tax=Sphingomonas crocodyli TaxID=1979270 RepID=A0A437M9Z6_9SPHN|nr:amidohydrolase family protein [Sphingomonas crocodyli]RVT94453.1 amidohydrolase [Sphingomonas crocodyli]